MPRYRYTFDIGALQAEFIARGVPVESVEGLPRIIVVTSRQLTASEKTALSRWILGAWSAYNVDTAETITFVREEEIT